MDGYRAEGRDARPLSEIDAAWCLCRLILPAIRSPDVIQVELMSQCWRGGQSDCYPITRYSEANPFENRLKRAEPRAPGEVRVPFRAPASDVTERSRHKTIYFTTLCREFFEMAC
jgi:hypothetical protein